MCHISKFDPLAIGEGAKTLGRARGQGLKKKTMADDRTGRRIFNNKTIKDRKSGCGNTCVAKDHEPYVVVFKKRCVIGEKMCMCQRKITKFVIALAKTTCISPLKHC